MSGTSEQAGPITGPAAPRFPSLLQHLKTHALAVYNYSRTRCKEPCEWDGRNHAEHQAAAWREACTIRTVEQLDALPGGAVVRDRDGDVYEHPHYAFAETKDSRWMEMGRSLDVMPDEDNLLLPALLVWHPDWETS